jgi:hypothetical protein
MKRSLIILAVASSLAACSGSGTSTTARGSDTEGDDSMSSNSNGDSDSDSESDTSDPTNNSSDPTNDTNDDGSTGETGDPGDETDGPGETDTSDPTDPTDPTSDDTTAGMDPVTIEGTWLSEGENVAPLLVELTNAVSISATFTSNTFTVTTVDGDGQEVSQNGVWIAEETEFGDIMAITLEQSVPQSITVEGIYEIDNSTNPPTMRYEVVQTVPSVGAQVPTPELGFGGTNLGADLTQIFIWQ